MSKAELRPLDKRDKEAAIKALLSYKNQNPVKFESKKAELVARYNITLEDLGEKTEEVSKKDKKDKEDNQSKE